MRRVLLWMSGLIAMQLLLASCNGSLTHKGQTSGESVFRPFKGDVRGTVECQVMCNQQDPNGRCIAWVEAKGEKCLTDMELKRSRTAQ